MKKPLIFLFIFLLLAAVASAQVLETDYTITEGTDGAFKIYVGKNLNKEISGQMYPINTLITPSTDPLFDYWVTGITNYNASFKEDPTEGQVVKYERKGLEVTYQPMALNWINDLNQIQQISMIQSVIGVPQGSRFIYPNAYGASTELAYDYHPNYLKEELILYNPLPAPPQYMIDGGNPRLELNFVFDTNSNHIRVRQNGQEWDLKSTIQAYSDIEILDDNQELMYFLKQPVAYDGAGTEEIGYYELKKSGNSLYISVVVGSYTWLSDPARVYPVMIDPTTQIDDDGNMIINLSDEHYNPLEEIELYNVSGDGEIRIDTNISDEDKPKIVYAYALDPTNLTFDYGITYVKNATGNKLLKCTEWDIDTEICGQCVLWNDTVCEDWEETWTEVDTLTIGESYNFTFDSVDPAYAEYNTSEGESTTAQITYQNKLTTQFNLTETGDYLVMASAEMTGTSTAYDVYVNGSFNSVSLAEVGYEPKEVLPTDEYMTYAATDIATLIPGTYTGLIDYRIEDTRATASIRNARMTTISLSDLEYESAENTSPQLMNTSWSTYESLSFTVPSDNEYWVIATGTIGDAGSASLTGYSRLLFEGTEIDGFQVEPKETTDTYTFTFQTVQNLTTGTTWDFEVQGLDEGAAFKMADIRMVAIAMGDSVFDLQYNESTALSTNTGATRLNKSDIEFTPAYEGSKYLAVATAQIYTQSTGQSGAAYLVRNGTDVCSIIKEQKELGADGDWLELQCFYPFNATSSEKFTIQWEQVDAADVDIRNARITVFHLDEDEQCNPTPNQDWIISDLQICDNVVRDIGTGQIKITGSGQLQLINNAMITSSGFPSIIHNTSQDYKISLERGSSLWLNR